jgi:tetratricopeptide (TPR) repeat protein
VRVLSAADESGVVTALASDKTQIVDARAFQQYLGLDAQQQAVGHLEGAVCVPYDSVFDKERGAFLATDALAEELEMAGVDSVADVVVIGSSAMEAAAVATALVLAKHTQVQLSLVVLSDAFVAQLPTALASGIFQKGDLWFASDDGKFDLSPDAVEPTATPADDGDSASLEKLYAERLKQPKGETGDDGSKGDQEDAAKAEEAVWQNAAGDRYFDMPSHMAKASFVEASRDIYRVVSFVLAPFGFPTRLQERFSVSEIKTRCSALYQDVIEVCSDLVYHHRGLTEGAMAMSVHKWVEKKRDPECSQQVRAINDLLDVLYAPPVFIEVPDLSDDRVVEIAEEMLTRLTDVIKKRAPWALEADDEGESELLAPEKGDDTEDDTTAKTRASNGWQGNVYPSVVYALGFMPPPPPKKHQRLSTLQIKSFIQAAAEAVWDVIGKAPCSQIEYQALCDTVGDEAKRKRLDAIKQSAERALYVLKHSLMQSLEREADVVDTLVAVRNTVEDGNRALRSGRHGVALSYFTSALAMLPVFHAEVAPALVGRVKCHIQLGHLETARSETHVLLAIDPFSVGAYTCLGEIDEKLSQHEQAMQHFVTAFILDGSRSPDHATAIDRVARVVGRNVAKDIFKEMELHHELPTQWLVDSYFDSFEHDIDYAARVPFDIEKSLSVDATELDTARLLSRAVHWKRKKQYSQAQADVRAVLSRADEGLLEDDTLRAMALNLHASFLYVAGDVHAALDAIAESLQLTPQSVNGLVKKGGFLSEIGDMDQAAACFEQAAEVDPNDADVYLHMGQKDLLEGKYYEAVQSLRRAMSRSEALPVTHVSYGMALYKSGSVYQAMDVFEDAAKHFPDATEVHLFYGDVLADQGDYARAMQHFVRALALSPQCPLPFLNAGRVYVTTNDPLRAIAHFQQALAIDPRCSSAHLDIAQVLFAQGRTAEAFHHFDRAAHCCRFLPEVEEVCSAQEMARMQERVTDILGVDLRHIMRSK